MLQAFKELVLAVQLFLQPADVLVLLVQFVRQSGKILVLFIQLFFQAVAEVPLLLQETLQLVNALFLTGDLAALCKKQLQQILTAQFMKFLRGHGSHPLRPRMPHIMRI